MHFKILAPMFLARPLEKTLHPSSISVTCQECNPSILLGVMETLEEAEILVEYHFRSTHENTTFNT